MDYFWVDRRCGSETDYARTGSGGIIVTILLGIAGALLGGFFGRAVG
jgi:uncharacterized membrane protein YeaQ/YmgE (transglycosylase-associated protein family)